LTNGGEVPASDLPHLRSELPFMAARGDLVYVTVRNNRRYALGPVPVAEDYLARTPAATGTDLTASQLISVRSELPFTADRGNVVFVTVLGERRYAIFPVELAVEHLRRTATTPADTDADTTDAGPADPDA
jgi:hypothetical protein